MVLPGFSYVGRRVSAFSEQRGWGAIGTTPFSGVCVALKNGGLDTVNISNRLRISRALLASNPIERRGGPCFHHKARPFPFVPPLCSENALFVVEQLCHARKIRMNRFYLNGRKRT